MTRWRERVGSGERNRGEAVTVRENVARMGGLVGLWNRHHETTGREQAKSRSGLAGVRVQVCKCLRFCAFTVWWGPEFVEFHAVLGENRLTCRRP